MSRKKKAAPAAPAPSAGDLFAQSIVAALPSIAHRAKVINGASPATKAGLGLAVLMRAISAEIHMKSSPSDITVNVDKHGDRISATLFDTHIREMIVRGCAFAESMVPGILPFAAWFQQPIDASELPDIPGTVQ